MPSSPRPEPALGDVPGSFVALYRNAGARGRLSVSLEELGVRYEYCEDLAQMLVDTARHAHLDAGLPEHDVLDRIDRGLQGGSTGVTPAEGRWALRRLAELLRWEPLERDPPAVDPAGDEAGQGAALQAPPAPDGGTQA